MVDGMMLERDEHKSGKYFTVVGIVVGLALFALGAVMSSVVALVGIGLAAAVAFNFTWKTLGPRTAR